LHLVIPLFRLTTVLPEEQDTFPPFLLLIPQVTVPDGFPVAAPVAVPTTETSAEK
jgi:hypothetical protein